VEGEREANSKILDKRTGGRQRKEGLKEEAEGKRMEDAKVGEGGRGEDWMRMMRYDKDES
jgi:hypothetical protein